MWQKNKPYFLVLPALSIIVIFFFGGICCGLLQSFGFFPVIGKNHFTFKFYKEILYSYDFWKSFLLTLKISTISTIISSILGLFVIFCLFIISSNGNHKFTLILQRFFILPMLIPYLVSAYLMVIMFMQSGWISRILLNLGFITEINDFPIIINDSSGWGIITTYVWKATPFIILMLYPVLLQVKSSWIEVAKVFGANKRKAFLEIVFPMLLPAWKISSFIIFAYTFSDFEVPFLLGVTYPKTLAVLSCEIYTKGELRERPIALAINAIFIFITLSLVVFTYFFSKKWTAYGGKNKHE
ncbi:ABC transporter permease [Clostridium sp. ZS2-4]|uniref:ABC transporter permease n=1 Tax=Clostridium sp. ZS2-4 TaxID=2987703 RepID=UPI00227D6C53|nr:ABC transporter permease subunit [Clostridium sp. ZS2-4]MCY6355770.1 ABC transporter permease subunit [Clostridium sp. ZS2-4]